ncbi:unnamed protein product [Closterium sp. NIES-54]
MDESRSRDTSPLSSTPRVTIRRSPSDRAPAIASNRTAAACIACSCDIDGLPDVVFLNILHHVISSSSKAVHGATTAIHAGSAPPYSAESCPNGITITTRDRGGYKQQQQLPCKDPTCTCRGKIESTAVAPNAPLLTCALVSRRWLRLSALLPRAITVPPGLLLRPRALLRTLSAFPHLRSVTLHADSCRSNRSSSRGAISDWLISRLATLLPQLTSLSLVGVAAIPRLSSLASSLLCLEIRGAGEGVTCLPEKSLGRLTCLQELVVRDCLALRWFPASLALLPSLQRISVEGCYLATLDAWTHTDTDGAGPEAVPSVGGDWQREVGERRRNDIKRDDDADVVVLAVSGGASDGEDVEASRGQQVPPGWRRRQRRQWKKLHLCQDKVQQQQLSKQGAVTTVTSAAQPRQPLFFSKLQHLELADVSALQHMPLGILQHHSLKHLVLDGYSGAYLSATCSANSESTKSMLEPPIRMPSLQHLVLRNLPNISQLPDCLSLPAACPSLAILSIKNCPHFSSLLTPPASLHTLKLHSLPNLTSICDSLHAHCPSLSVLVIDQCANLHTLPCFPSRTLSHVEIRNLQNLTALTSPFSPLNPSSSARLSILAIDNCPLLAIHASARTPLALNFPGLRELWLHDLPLLHELPPSFSCLSSLQRLVITRCHGLNSLPDCMPELPLLRDLALVVNHNLTVPRDFLPQLHSVRRLVVHRGRENKTIIAHDGRVRPKFGLPPRVKELHTDDFGSDVLQLRELERLEVSAGYFPKMSINEIRVMEEVMKVSEEGGRRDAGEEEGNDGFDVKCWEGGRRLAWVTSALESHQSNGEDSTSEVAGSSRSRSSTREHGKKHLLPCLQRLTLADCVVGPHFPPWMRHLTSLQHLSLTHVHQCTELYCPAEQFNEPHQLRRLLKAYLQDEEHWENLTSLHRVDTCACCPIVVPSEWQSLVRAVDAAAEETAACGGDVIRKAGFLLGDLGAGTPTSDEIRLMV